MAPKSKKRLCNSKENKLLKLGTLQLSDVICSVCQSILIEPVTLPCFHDFCKLCFNGSIENNALSCPLCRLRIGSWLRSTAKQKKIVNVMLWNFLKKNFSKEIEIKLKGDELDLPEEKPLLRLSAPGEIRSEYEAELKRLESDRLLLEQKHLEESEKLVKKIQEEEEEAHRKYLEIIKQDEILAQTIQESGNGDLISFKLAPTTSRSQYVRSAALKSRFKVIKIDNFLCKRKSSVAMAENSSITDDNTSSKSSTNGRSKFMLQTSPEIVPTCSKYLRDDTCKDHTSAYPKNSENNRDPSTSKNVSSRAKLKGIGKGSSSNSKQSLRVSLPNKSGAGGAGGAGGAASVDSMRQELCYFKPIEGTTPTSFKVGKGLPLRVPVRRAAGSPPPAAALPAAAAAAAPPPAEQRLDGLCRLRNLSLAHNLPSAFAIALNIIRTIKEISPKSDEHQSKPTENITKNVPTIKQSYQNSRQIQCIEGNSALNSRSTLRRTRSMGSIGREESTPKKTKIQDRKVASERKPHLRSDTKKCDARNLYITPLRLGDVSNNNVNLAVKRISSPLENTHVKVILEEQLRIERMIEQEKRDLELARKVDAQLNGARGRRRGRGARPASPSPPPPAPPAKKLRVL